MIYKWDDSKLKINLEAHKVDFSLAEEFNWLTAIIKSDDGNDYGKQRYQAYGLIQNRLYCLVFTLRNGRTRIISLRKANKREVQSYETKNYLSD